MEFFLLIWGMGNREWGIGNGEQGIGNGEQGMGNREQNCGKNIYIIFVLGVQTDFKDITIEKKDQESMCDLIPSPPLRKYVIDSEVEATITEHETDTEWEKSS